MKQKNILMFVLLLSVTSVFAQIKPEQFKAFVGSQEIIDSSGPGLKAASGDILLELKDEEDPDVETLMLLRNVKGKLSKIAENSSLLMGHDILGVSGGNYPDLSDNKLSIDYTIGSNSAQSDISMVFEKNGDGNYYFMEYTSKTRNYGVENLFARQKITAQQTGKINFAEASETIILERSKVKTLPYNVDEPLNEVEQRCAKYVPEGWRWSACSEGDLNEDGKSDLLVVLYDEESCRIELLLQQKDGSYKTAQTNDALIIPDEFFNANNLKSVIKNSFFTIEQRIAVDDNDFDHRYITFKYNAAQKNWFLHRFDVEHFNGFDPKPSKEVTHLSTKEFGSVAFSEMTSLPGIYRFEPAVSVISGTIVIKQFYGAPNYGETPEKDEKVGVYILKPDYPVNVFADLDPKDPETADKTITNITEIQVYSPDKKIDLKNYEGKRIQLNGLLFTGRSGHHYTNVLMEVKKILQ